MPFFNFFASDIVTDNATFVISLCNNILYHRAWGHNVVLYNALPCILYHKGEVRGINSASVVVSAYPCRVSADYNALTVPQNYVTALVTCKRFSEVMRCSVIEYASAVRLNEARYLLSTTCKSIEEIAELCGYSSANYFSLIFKSKMGIVPSNYRKKTDF